MTIITLDFDPVDASQMEPVPEGTYECQVAAVTPKVSQAGNKMLELRLDIVNDPIYSGRSLFDNVVLVPQAAWKLVSVMRALGVDPKAQFDTTSWIGLPVVVDVGLESYEIDGERRSRNRINKYRRS